MIRFLIDIYILVIIADVVISYLPQYSNQEWAKKVRQFAGYSLNPVRKLLPGDLPFDFSPIVVILLLQLFIFLF